MESPGFNDIRGNAINQNSIRRRANEGRYAANRGTISNRQHEANAEITSRQQTGNNDRRRESVACGSVRLIFGLC